MGHGGRRPGAGRPKGSVTKRSQEILSDAIGKGLSPLEYLLLVMRDETKDETTRLDAAKAAAPYVHPRLAAIEHSGSVSMSWEDALEELDRIQRSNIAKAQSAIRSH